MGEQGCAGTAEGRVARHKVREGRRHEVGSLVGHPLGPVLVAVLVADSLDGTSLLVLVLEVPRSDGGVVESKGGGAEKEDGVSEVGAKRT